MECEMIRESMKVSSCHIGYNKSLDDAALCHCDFILLFCYWCFLIVGR